jgi:hypothetical protein
MLRKHGLEDERGYAMAEAPFPTMRAILAEKKVQPWRHGASGLPTDFRKLMPTARRSGRR